MGGTCRVRFWEVRRCLSKLNKSTKLSKFSGNPPTTQWELPDRGSGTVNGFVRICEIDPHQNGIGHAMDKKQGAIPDLG